MSDTHEEWRIIQETDGKYSISNKGRVRNKHRVIKMVIDMVNQDQSQYIDLWRRSILCEQQMIKKTIILESD